MLLNLGSLKFSPVLLPFIVPCWTGNWWWRSNYHAEYLPTIVYLIFLENTYKWPGVLSFQVSAHLPVSLCDEKLPDIPHR